MANIAIAYSFKFRYFSAFPKSPLVLHQTQVISEVSFVDFRVGKVLEIVPHKEVGDKVYVTKVDVGEPMPRTMCAGVAHLIPSENILNKLVITCCNLKPRNIEGVISTGMILVAKDADLENVRICSKLILHLIIQCSGLYWYHLRAQRLASKFKLKV